jgi:hypothetical protein
LWKVYLLPAAVAVVDQKGQTASVAAEVERGREEF